MKKLYLHLVNYCLPEYGVRKNIFIVLTVRNSVWNIYVCICDGNKSALHLHEKLSLICMFWTNSVESGSWKRNLDSWTRIWNPWWPERKRYCWETDVACQCRLLLTCPNFQRSMTSCAALLDSVPVQINASFCKWKGASTRTLGNTHFTYFYFVKSTLKNNILFVIIYYNFFLHYYFF